jgi:hypothetical protein
VLQWQNGTWDKSLLSSNDIWLPLQSASGMVRTAQWQASMQSLRRGQDSRLRLTSRAKLKGRSYFGLRRFLTGAMRGAISFS